MILDRGVFECDRGCSSVFALSQYIAPVDLDGVSQFSRLFPRYGQRDQFGAAYANIPPFAVMLEAQKPGSSSPLVHFKEKPIPILIGTGSRQMRLDRYCCEFSHEFTPTFSPLKSGGPSVGERIFPPSYPHTRPEMQ